MIWNIVRKTKRRIAVRYTNLTLNNSEAANRWPCDKTLTDWSILGWIDVPTAVKRRGNVALDDRWSRISIWNLDILVARQVQNSQNVVQNAHNVCAVMREVHVKRYFYNDSRCWQADFMCVEWVSLRTLYAFGRLTLASLTVTVAFSAFSIDQVVVWTHEIVANTS